MRSLFLLLLFNQSFAQTIQITEIQPFKLNNQEEWFEFQVFGVSEIDFHNWKIKNDKKTIKLFQDYEDILLSGDNIIKKSPLSFEIINNFGIFSWKKSPLSLPNDGGVIEIINPQNEVKARAQYLKPRYGKNKQGEWAESLNLALDNKTFTPLINNYQQNNQTKLLKNKNLPTLPIEFSIFFTEVSPRNNQRDFIEIILASGPKKINLKYLSIKHNGSTLWRFENDFWIKPGERILIYFDQDHYGITKNTAPYEIVTNKKIGLSSGSGSVELIHLSETSAESVANFWCWKNKILSKTEEIRVNKKRLAHQWQDECYDVKNLIENESIALRDETKKALNKNRFFTHFNGSPGEENKSQNQQPQAIIEVQGSKKIHGPVPFNLNLSGEKSVDPDGPKDIKFFTWHLNGQEFSNRSNPGNLKIEIPGKHLVTLSVIDQSGSQNTKALEVTTYIKESPESQKDSEQIIREIIFNQEKIRKSHSSLVAKVLKNHKEKAMTSYPPYPEVIKKSLAIKNTFKNHKIPSIKKIRLVSLPKEVRRRASKNLGIIFTWRESPWPDLVVESTFDEEFDQRFARFEAGYLGASPAPYKRSPIAVTQFSDSTEAQ